jgi:hypothetical protein
MKLVEFNLIFKLLELKGINVSKIDKDNIQDKIFEIPDDIDNLVYWDCDAVANERHGNTERRQGIITKEEYQIILKLDKNSDIKLDEISKYVNMCCYLKDFSFSQDKEIIIDFKNSGNDDFPLMDYIDYDYDDEI